MWKIKHGTGQKKCFKTRDAGLEEKTNAKRFVCNPCETQRENDGEVKRLRRGPIISTTESFIR